jgi:hypothetical protein
MGNKLHPLMKVDTEPLDPPDCHFQLLEFVNVVYSEEYIELHLTGMLSRHAW